MIIGCIAYFPSYRIPFLYKVPCEFSAEHCARMIGHDWLTNNDSTNQKQYSQLSYPTMRV